MIAISMSDTKKEYTFVWNDACYILYVWSRETQHLVMSESHKAAALPAEGHVKRGTLL